MKLFIATALFILSAPAFAQTQSEAASKSAAQNVLAKMTPDLRQACGDAAAMNKVMMIYHEQLKNQYADYVDVVIVEENIKDKTGLDISFGDYEYWNDSWLSIYDHEDLAKARANFCAKAGK